MSSKKKEKRFQILEVIKVRLCILNFVCIGKSDDIGTKLCYISQKFRLQIFQISFSFPPKSGGLKKHMKPIIGLFTLFWVIFPIFFEIFF